MNLRMVFGWLACLLAVSGCTPPPPAPPAAVAAARPAPDAATLLKIKTDAYASGVAAGRRWQARHDAAALAAAQAALATATRPACPAQPNPATVTPLPTPLPGTVPAPVYTPDGPAVPVAPAQ